MNQLVTIGNLSAVDFVREQQLNNAILRGDATIDPNHYLSIFDRFYADDVVIAEAAHAIPVHGKKENRERLESFIGLIQIIFEVGGYEIDHLRLADSHVEDGACVSHWEIGFCDPQGDWRVISRKIRRVWSAGKVVVESWSGDLRNVDSENVWSADPERPDD